jgi:HlyD family secretion protein
VSSLISSVIATQQSLSSSESSLRQAQASYDLKKAPPTEDDIIIAQAQLTNAEATYLNAQNTYSNTVVTAPFDAVVGAVNAKIGDQASAGTAMFTLITSNQLADIALNEVDATKVHLGQKATLTFDAVPDLILAGTVSEVSPLGAVSQGVVSYSVKVSLDTLDSRVKPGMSVNANIITGIKEDVLVVPNEAVKSQARTSYVEVPYDGFTSASTSPVVTLPTAPSRVTVTVGVSNDSSTEIVSGLTLGDWVVVKTTKPGTTTQTRTTQQTGFSALGGSRGLGR